ncbi:hypothetical protein [Caballeronia sp. GAFFF1]|uniref:hypothetical protein n=1 Tax=Caballeronia sp. GAFFF1 TaxID=2921779 RepID=UPI00202833A3|nr:hypothetical protein [Caballeronia sp. GAFFF1]
MATIAEVFRELAAEGGTARVTVVSNQGDGIASYTVGTMFYVSRPSSAQKGEAPAFMRDHLSSDGADAQVSFSDRFVSIDAGNGSTEQQPFSMRATNMAAIAIAPAEGSGQDSKTWLVNIRLPGPFNRTLDFKANVDGSTLVGTSSTAIGITEHVDTAVFVVSLKRDQPLK